MSSGLKKGLAAGLAAGGIIALIGGYLGMSSGVRTLKEIRPRDYLTYTFGEESKFDHELYADAFERSDDYEERLRYTDAYLERYPDSQLAMANKAYLLIADGQNEEGILLNQKVLAIHGPDSSAYNNMGWAYVNLGRYKLAIHYLELAISANGGSPTYYELVNLGDAYQGLKQYEQAVEYFQQANREFRTDAESNPPHGLYGLAETYQLMDRDEEALEVYLKILEIDPSDYLSFVSGMDIFREMGEADGLVSFAMKYLSDNPDALYVYSNVAYALYELEQYEESADYYLLYAENSEYPAYGYYYAAESYLLAGDKEMAKLYIGSCLKSDPDYSAYLADEELWGWLDD